MSNYLLFCVFLSIESVPEGRRRSRFFSSDATSLSRHGGEGCEDLLFKSIADIKVCVSQEACISGTIDPLVFQNIFQVFDKNSPSDSE